MKHKIECWADSVLGRMGGDENPSETIIEVLKDKNPNTETIKRLVEAVNTKLYIKNQSEGKDMEAKFPLADAKQVSVVLLKDDLKKSALAEWDYYFEEDYEPVDYFKQAHFDNSKLEFTVERSPMCEQLHTVEHVPADTMNKEASGLYQKNIKQIAARECAKELKKFAQMYYSDQDLMSELRYLYPNSLVLEKSGQLKGKRKIPQRVNSIHKQFEKCELLFSKLANQKKRDLILTDPEEVALAAEKRKERSRAEAAKYKTIQTAEKRKNVEEANRVRDQYARMKGLNDAGVTTKELAEAEGIKARLGIDKVKTDREFYDADVAGKRKQLKEQGKVEKQRGFDMGIDAANYARQEMGSTGNKFHETTNNMLANLADITGGEAYANLLANYRHRQGEFNLGTNALNRLRNYKRNLKSIYQENTLKAIQNVSLKANFEDIMQDDPMLEGADPYLMLDAYKTAMTLAPHAMQNKELLRSFLRSVNSMGTSAIDPASASQLAKLERELLRAKSYPGMQGQGNLAELVSTLRGD